MYLFEELYQTLALVFNHVSKHLKLSLKNSAAPRFSTSVLGVWKHDQTPVRVFDILRQNILTENRINKETLNILACFFVSFLSHPTLETFYKVSVSSLNKTSTVPSCSQNLKSCSKTGNK